MICDKCVKKTVCKICDGSEIIGCIEFYRSHDEVLQEIREEIADYKDDKIIHAELNEMIDIILALIDDKIEEYTK